MLLRFFKQSLIQVLAVIIFIAAVLWVSSFFKSSDVFFYFDYQKMPFFELITSISPSKIWLQILLNFTISLISGLYLIQFNSKHIVIKHRSYLPALFFILICSSIPSLQKANPAVFASFFFILAFDHIFSIYHKEQVFDNLFRAGFYISTASLFYAPALLYLLPLIFSILSIRTFNPRELFVTLIGYMTPWLLYSLYTYIAKDDWGLFINLIKENLWDTNSYPYTITLLNYITLGFLLFIFLPSGLFLFNSLQSQKINVRKYFGVFYWFNLTTIIILFTIPLLSIEIIYLFAVPYAFQLSYYFSLSKGKFWPQFLFTMLLACIFLPHLLCIYFP